MLIDLDHFKKMNDIRGHAFGDAILKYFSSTLRLSLETDEMDTTAKEFVFRFGGDEFIIVFSGKNSEQAYKLAVNILYKIKHRPCLFKGRSYKISFSGGIASFPRDAKAPNELIEKADKAMYLSKKTGKGKVTCYNRLNFEKIKPVFLFMLILSLTSLVFIEYCGKGLFFGRANNLIYNKPWKFGGQFNKSRNQEISTIHLKTGGILKGAIIHDGDPLVIKIKFNKGESSVSLNRSEILNIEYPEDN